MHNKMKIKSPSHGIESATTYHSFNYETHSGCPLFFLTLRAQHPKNPLQYGIAREDDHGHILTQHLTPDIINDIINETFQHHIQHQTTEYIALQLVQINQRYTEHFTN
jgi:hypothetical protein